MQAIKPAVKKIKTVTKNALFIKVNKTATIRDIARKNLSKKGEKTTCKKGKLDKMLKIGMTTQGDKGGTQPLD